MSSSQPIQIDPTGPAASTYLALIGGILCIGFAPIFVRFASSSGDVIGFYRLGIAAAALTAPFAIQQQRRETPLARRGIWLALLGGLAFAIDVALWATGINLTTASNATVMSNVAPLWVALASWMFFHERLGPLYWVGLGVAMTGVVTIVGIDALKGLDASAGNLFALGASLAYAMYQLLTTQARRYMNSLTYSWIFSASGALVLFVTALILGNPILGLPWSSYRALLAIGLISHLGGWLLINHALGHLRTTTVSVSLLGQPLTATLIALPLLGEVPTWWHLLGGALTLTGIAIVILSHKRKPDAPVPTE